MQIEAQIREFILQNLYFSEDTPIGDEDSFLQTGVIDSMGVMELVSFVQSRFGVTVAPSEVVVEHFDSIRQLAQFIQRKLAAKGANTREQAVTADPVRTIASEEQTTGPQQILA
jgi:acyl carrier protein